MKIKFPISDFRFPIEKKSAPSARNLQPSTFNLQPSERGIALVITLILLAVTLVMAVAFLTISQRERGSVTTTTDTATARLAADSALANAEAQIIASILTTNTAAYNFGLLVSTNYINTNGVNGSVDPTNVNYEFAANPDRNVAIGNLFYAPRAPVFIVTNTQTGSNDFRFYLDLNRNRMFDPTGTMPETNNLDEPTGNTVSEIGDPQWIGVLEHPDAPHGPDNKFISRYAFVAMPIGNTLDLNYIHNEAVLKAVNLNDNNPVSESFFRNQGVGSWELNLAAFLADLNTNVWDPVGNPYNYLEWKDGNNPDTPNEGLGFQDALALLSYRYGYTYSSLAYANALFQNPVILRSDNIDEYSDGPLQTGIPSIREFKLQDPVATEPWAGADNTNQFFNLSADLYDTTKTENGMTIPGFTDHLLQATTNSPSTYDRYTFYRLLSQLGTGSAPESGKINLNYSNAVVYYSNLGVPTNITIIPGAETNLVPWAATNFFNAAANQLLRTYTTSWFQSNPSNYLVTYYGVPAADANYYHNDSFGNVITNDATGFGLTNFPYFGITNQIPAFGVTNIPVYVNGQYAYSSAVNRLLQLVANIYDATTNRYSFVDVNNRVNNLPTVFRPIFDVVNNGGHDDVYVSGYSEVTGAFEPDLPLIRPLDLANPTDFSKLLLGFNSGINIFGVPMIIGAKAGLPNFNQFAMQSIFQITRKIELTRNSTNDDPSTYKLNQKFAFGSATSSGLADQLEVECWNSYSSYPSNYTRATDIYVNDFLTMNLTNDEGFSTIAALTISGGTNISVWPGYNATMPGLSFVIPLNTNAVLVPTNSIYRFNSDSYGFGPHMDTNAAVPYESNVVVNGDQYPQPHWWLITTNNIQVAMVDHDTGRLIDYVQLRGPNSVRDLSNEISTNAPNLSKLLFTNYEASGILAPAGSFAGTAVQLPAGVENQLLASRSEIDPGWSGPDAEGFNNFIHPNTSGSGSAYGSTNLQFQVYSPPMTAVQFTTWQANDPLVHYLASDLYDPMDEVGENRAGSLTAPVNPLIETTALNERYQPWSNKVLLIPNTDQNPYYLAIRDPLVWSSDYWNFPAGKFPTVGWLGRVHRGTPWQTVYLKSLNVWDETETNAFFPNGANIGINTWAYWTGDFNTIDAFNSIPAQDGLLFDVFTTALNDNATRGQLSVNVGADDSLNPQAGLAAWSALFSGVMVLSNNVNDRLLVNDRLVNSATPLSYTANPINPAGLDGVNSLLGQLVANINYTRARFINANNLVGTFEHVGDILAVPRFSDQSPFLRQITNGVLDQMQGTITNPVVDWAQATNGISDAMYEWLPQQTMSLLSCPTAGPRYVIYSYGQTLKPAPGGIVTGFGSYFGMVTNYQVVAETATRAVVQVHPVIVTNFNGFTTNYSTTIEQFNVLPPD